MVNKKKEESVHVCLQGHLQKRRDILQATIDLVQLLKRYDSIKRIRHEKEMNYLEFKKCMGSVNFFLRRIKMKDMPLSSDDLDTYKIKPQETEKIVEPVMKKVKKALIKQEKKEDRDKLSLDRQLEDLKRKLNSI